jgi:CobQ-like glutamine amidotransferase family enzyme
MNESEIVIVDVLPELLGTYGDYGNIIVLAKRIELSDVKVRIVHATQSVGIPENGDIYVLGGGEDNPQAEAARILSGSKSLNAAHDKGAIIFGVCAGYQLLGNSFVAEGNTVEGLGIVDIHSLRGRQRSVGELVVESKLIGSKYLLSGFENHGGVTILGENVKPLGKAVIGSGNGAIASDKNDSFKRSRSVLKRQVNKFIKYLDGSRKVEIDSNFQDGIIADNVICTYMHGPVLARNYMLADYLISKIDSSILLSEPLAELNLISEKLRLERLEKIIGHK